MSSCTKRAKLSGAAYRRQREERREANQRSASRIQRFFVPIEAVSTINSIEEISTGPNHEDTVSSLSALGSIDRASFSAESDYLMGSDAGAAETHIGEVDSDIFHDSGVWNIQLSDSIRIEIVSRGPVDLQNKEGPFLSIEKPGSRGEIRSLTKEWFYRILENGERVLRSWMLYSPTNGCLYCFCCRLFLSQKEQETQSAFTRAGFQKWWKLNPKVVEHEKSREHHLAFDKWKELEMRLNMGETLDKNHLERMESERKKWIDILHRIMDIILFLARQNLALRGHRESLDAEENPGNFIELVKLISSYDPVLREHLTRIRMAPNITVTYLSPKIQNELIELLARHVKQKIVNNIKEAKYYSMLFDSTPDISHTDQMTQIIRYVVIQEGTVQILESFIDFIPLKEKTSEDITKMILQKLDNDGININDCRGQGYDNAASMAGIHRGVQQRIKNVNEKAEFIACTNHSLNLAGVHAAGEP